MRFYRTAKSKVTRPDREALTRDAVVWACRLYLDREPESDQVIDEHLRKCATTEQLRANFIYSNEFRDKNPNLHVPVLSGDEPAMTIEEVSSEEDLQSFSIIFNLTGKRSERVSRTGP